MISDVNGHNPLPENVTIRQSKLHGMGLFATKDIASQHDFGITHVYDERFPNKYIRTPLGGFINHSNDPNCIVYENGDTLHIKTIRLVRTGEELTLNYRPYYPDKLVSTFK